MKNKIKFIFFVFGVLTIFFTGVYWWFVKSFGNINILQILWHIENASTLKEFDDSLIRHFIQWIGICLLGCIAWFFLLYKRSVIYIYIYDKIKKINFKDLFINNFDRILYVIIILSSIVLVSSAYNKFSFYDLIKLKLAEYCDNDFFLDNYAVPRTEDVTFEKKNNLIIILLESMSNHLHVSDETVSYIPQLESLYATYQHHEQLYNCRNTTWTIGALTSWCFGVPLNLPGSIDGNSYEAGNFLPNAASIFDILKKNDYSSWLFMGSSAQFAGTNYLFERGDYTVYDLEYFREKNKITEQNRSNWGLYDFFLYDEMYKKYLELREQNKPFVLFMQTIDTHAPGFAPKNKVHYGDIRDSWLNADDMLYAFLKKMAPFLETDNINILIFGDHIVMGEYEALNAQDSLFNLFAGKHIPQIPESKLTQNINPMDIAPTILQAAGAKWNNDQFGLGISIFSTEKSFSEREGREGLDEKLLYHSKFYDNFF